MLEWLVAMRLWSMKGSEIGALPIFQQAQKDAACPEWFASLKKFAFSTVQVDFDGDLMELVLKDGNTNTIVFPVKEARPDVSTTLN